jgi:subtilisin family serine protease
MNRQNFLGHLALALTLILIAAFVGQIRHWQHWKRPSVSLTVTTSQEQQLGISGQKKTEILVRFRQGTSLERIRSIVAGHKDFVERHLDFEGLEDAIEDSSGEAPETLAGEYASLPEVEFAEPNFAINLDPEPWARVSRRGDGEPRDASPDDPEFGEQWSLDNTGQRGGKPKADISAILAWKKTTGNDDTVVAVLDSGVDYTHPDLIENIWVRPDDVAAYVDEQAGAVNDEHGYNAITLSGDPMDDNGHGTHCAGIIGAKGGNGIGIAGINWTVQIMPLKFMSAGGFGTTKDAIECIDYVIDRKRKGVPVRIISASWGSTQKSLALEDAIRRAGEEDILFVAASGNASTNNDKSPHYPSSYNLPNVISVASLDRHDALSSFSNFGAKSVHIAAPGSEILSTWLNGGFEEHSGTSMATPEVAGVAALVLSTNPDMSVTDLRERLFRSVDPLPELKGKVLTGGRVNAAKAVGAE